MALDWYLVAREQGFETPKQMLEKLYVEQDYSIKDVADIVGCSSWSVRFALEKFDVPIKQHGGRRYKEVRQ